MNEKIEIDIIENDILKLSENLMKILLKDRTTKKNIIWATNDYKVYGLKAEEEMKVRQVTGEYTKIIQPRVTKNKKKQENRTKDKAEVFTPSWICNEQNNLIDEAWFGKKEIFNIENKNKWNTIYKKIEFPPNKTWQQYVTSNRMEITCGEAPYLVSRYDTVTGKKINVEDRIGILDRKLRIISENIDDECKWITWAKKAYQSTYGYEYQGDNLLLARENLLYTFTETYYHKFKKNPAEKDIKSIATIISWNIWQMDGITFKVPYCAKENLYQQLTLFDDENTKNEKQKGIYCTIKNWTNKINNIIIFKEMIGGNK